MHIPSVFYRFIRWGGNNYWDLIWFLSIEFSIFGNRFANASIWSFSHRFEFAFRICVRWCILPDKTDSERFDSHCFVTGRKRYGRRVRRRRTYDVNACECMCTNATFRKMATTWIARCGDIYAIVLPFVNFSINQFRMHTPQFNFHLIFHFVDLVLPIALHQQTEIIRFDVRAMFAFDVWWNDDKVRVPFKL